MSARVEVQIQTLRSLTEDKSLVFVALPGVYEKTDETSAVCWQMLNWAVKLLLWKVSLLAEARTPRRQRRIWRGRNYT